MIVFSLINFERYGRTLYQSSVGSSPVQIVDVCFSCKKLAGNLISRRLGGESNREILVVPGCVILSLFFFRDACSWDWAGVSALVIWCLPLFCQIE